MFGIGQFAQFAKVSVRTLRHYDDVGLLRILVLTAIAADSVRHTWDSYSQTIRRVLLQHRLEPDIAAVTSSTIALHGSADRVAPIGLVAVLAARRLLEQL